MTKETIYPSISVTHINVNYERQLLFSKSEPQPNFTTECEKRKLNWFGKQVYKIRHGETKAAQITKLVLLILLPLSLLGIPLLVASLLEIQKQNKNEKQLHEAQSNVDLTVKLFNQRANVIERLGLKDFAKVPELDLKGRVESTGYIDFLQPKDLSANIMKGFDSKKRPFIAFKLTKLDTSEELVVTLFQRYPLNDRWECGTDYPKRPVELLESSSRFDLIVATDSLSKLIIGETVQGYRLAP